MCEYGIDHGLDKYQIIRSKMADEMGRGVTGGWCKDGDLVKCLLSWVISSISAEQRTS